MAPSVKGVTICKHLFVSKGFLRVALAFFTICMNVPAISSAQPGFLSIDCGSRANYTDSVGLEWVADVNSSYIKTGVPFQQEAFNSTTASGSFSSLAGYNQQALLSFRYFPGYFPERRSKFCYELPTPGDRYLIRASFYMNESVLHDRAPFHFILSINATNWFTVTGNLSVGKDLLVLQEAIFYSRGPVTYFCLQPVVGDPFISSLELRPLKDNVYSYTGSDTQYLALTFRYNIGAKPSTPAVRYGVDLTYRFLLPTCTV